MVKDEQVRILMKLNGTDHRYVPRHRHAKR